MLLSESQIEELQFILSQFFAKPIFASIEETERKPYTPSHYFREQQALALEKAKQDIQDDKNVQALLQAFDATISEVEPID